MKTDLELPLYHKEGNVEQNVGAVILLITGVGVATLVLIFVGVLGGQVYTQVQNDIGNITDATTRAYVTEAIQSGFQALSLTGSYLPIVVLAVIIFIVLALVMGVSRVPAQGGYSGAL